MKKIMYVHHGDIKGGAPMSLKFLLEKINSCKYQTTVVCRVGKEECEFFKINNTKVISEPRIKPFHGSTVSGIDFKQIIYNFVYAFPTYYAMQRIVKEEKPDVVHLNSTCLFMCAKAVKNIDKNVKVICHIREPLLPNIWGNILKKMSNKYCDYFIAIDEYDRKSVDPDNKKTKVIYNFVDFSVFDYRIKTQVLRKELNLNKNEVIFLVLARISQENGILELVEKWSKNIQDNKSQLVIVGEIQGREEMYTRKCHEISDNTDNINILTFRPDTVNVISSADVIVCPFIQPHFARMVVEGAAMKKPSISNNIEGPQELIVEKVTGMFYSNEKELVSIVRNLTYDEDLRNKLGNNAYKRAVENFNADINAKKTFDLYER